MITMGAIRTVGVDLSAEPTGITAASFATGPRTTVYARSPEDGRCR